MVSQLKLGDIAVDVMFKDIRNVYLSVHPPTGRVRISAPSHMSLDRIRVFAISKLAWIRKHQTKLRGQERETPREYLDRESHHVWGKRYLLKVIECDEPPAIELKHSEMLLRLRPRTHHTKKQAVMEEWYRDQIKEAVPRLIAKWEPVMGVNVDRFFVQRMKTKWGSCNANTRSIRLNTDLAKKSPEYLEYIVVHEMAHLVVRHHDDRFGSLMSRCLPNWKLLRQGLNSAPLAHADWAY